MKKSKLSLLVIMILNYFPYVILAQTNNHTLKFNSVPIGVKVFIDNEYLGLTPIELKNLSAGTFRIRMEDERIEPYETVVNYYNQTDIQIYPVLDGDYGIIQVVCSETNADIYIDDSLYGKSPLSAVKLKSGVYQLKIVKKDYDIVKKTIAVTPCVDSVKTNLIYSYGFLTVKDTAQNSSIILDGDNIRGYDLEKYKLLTGEHNLFYKCNADGHEDEIDFNIKSACQYVAVVNHNNFTFHPFLQSLLIPGLGQYNDNSKMEGVEIFGATLLSGLLFYITQSKYDNDRREYNNQRTNYLSARNEFEAVYYRGLMNDAEAQANNSQTYRNISLGLLAGVYIYNWIDALLNHSTKDEIRLFEINNNFDVSNQNIRLDLNIPLTTIY